MPQQAAVLEEKFVSHLHMFRLNMVLHLRLWDGFAAVAAYFNVSAAVDFMNDEISSRNIFFAVRKLQRLPCRKFTKNNSKQFSIMIRQANKHRKDKLRKLPKNSWFREVTKEKCKPSQASVILHRWGHQAEIIIFHIALR